MCGIFGYVGPRDAGRLAVEGLKKLEYRGYDSSGIAGIYDGQIFFCKEVGKIALMEEKLLGSQVTLNVAIAQTRWATHGKPTKVNAHPHFDMKHTLAIVHNGIIENHSILRSTLEKKGVVFASDTDSEVIAHLVADFYEGDILKAVQHAFPLLKGSFAVALIHKDYPDQIIAMAHEMPLAVGLGKNENFVASDPNAFGAHAREVLYLADGEVAVIKPDSCDLYDADMVPITKKAKTLIHELEVASKGEFEHYTLKEIYEQPQTLRAALLSRFVEEYGTAIFDELRFETAELLNVERILVVACGTSWHAGYVGSYLFENQVRIPTEVEIASEFRYKNPVILPGTLVIAISQSGETADTLAAVRELKAKGAKILALCNVHESSLAREADSCLFLRAGIEVGVCSTKAFTSQVAVLSLFALLMARMRNMTRAEGQEFLLALKKLPDQVQQVLDQAKTIEAIAKKYARHQNFFFLGRQYMYPAALEGALKLKEIAYVNANGYPAGEMKHGPIALINENCPTVAFCANKATYDKMLSNLMEVKARNGEVIAIVEEGIEGLEKIANDVIRIPQTIDELTIIPSTVAAQLFAYYMARERGAEIDQPRNLAKSVTVE